MLKCKLNSCTNYYNIYIKIIYFYSDIKASKESKHIFEKAASELDAALLRNSQILKSSRPHEADELLSQVSSARNSFRHAALDHVHCITMLLARKKPEIFSTVSN